MIVIIIIIIIMLLLMLLLTNSVLRIWKQSWSVFLFFHIQVLWQQSQE